MALKAVFIDKDGTLLQDVPYNVDPSLVRLTPNALKGLRRMVSAGFGIVCVSNQSGLARGYFKEAQLAALISDLRRTLAAAGVPMLGFYYCPHHTDGVVPEYRRQCDCRKPRPGLFLRAAEELNISLHESFAVGDILDDVEAAKTAGCRPILLDRGSETEWRMTSDRRPEYVVTDLDEAADIVVAAAVATPAAGAGGSGRRREDR